MYSIVSVCTRFGVNDTGYSLSPPLFSHSCLAKARARWNESERKPLVSLRLSDAVSLRRTQSVPSRSPLRPERSEKRTLGLGSLFTIRVTRRSRPVSTYGDNTVIEKNYSRFEKITFFLPSHFHVLSTSGRLASRGNDKHIPQMTNHLKFIAVSVASE